MLNPNLLHFMPGIHIPSMSWFAPQPAMMQPSPSPSPPNASIATDSTKISSQRCSNMKPSNSFSIDAILKKSNSQNHSSDRQSSQQQHNLSIYSNPTLTSSALQQLPHMRHHNKCNAGPISVYGESRTSLRSTPYPTISSAAAAFSVAALKAAMTNSNSSTNINSSTVNNVSPDCNGRSSVSNSSQIISAESNGASTVASSGSRGTRPKRIRTIFTAEQLERLEMEFRTQQYMVGAERVLLARQLQLTEAQVKVWFQNRRIKWRKQNLERNKQHLTNSEYLSSSFDETGNVANRSSTPESPNLSEDGEADIARTFTIEIPTSTSSPKQVDESRSPSPSSSADLSERSSPCLYGTTVGAGRVGDDNTNVSLPVTSAANDTNMISSNANVSENIRDTFSRYIASNEFQKGLITSVHQQIFQAKLSQQVN